MPYTLITRTPVSLTEFVNNATPPANDGSVPGLPLFNVSSFKVMLDPIGGTLSGGGHLRAWWRDGLGTTRRMPDLDIALDSTADSGSAGRTTGDMINELRAGELVYQPDAVTQSAGTTCTLTMGARTDL